MSNAKLLSDLKAVLADQNFTAERVGAPSSEVRRIAAEHASTITKAIELISNAGLTPPTDEPPIHHRLFEANVRIENAWPFPMSPAPDDLLDAFSHHEGAFPDQIEALMSGWNKKERAELTSGKRQQIREAYDAISSEAFFNNVFGWVALVAVPEFRPNPSGSISFSWGSYGVDFIFAETADKLLIAAAELGEKKFEDAKNGRTFELTSERQPG